MCTREHQRFHVFPTILVDATRSFWVQLQLQDSNDLLFQLHDSNLKTWNQTPNSGSPCSWNHMWLQPHGQTGLRKFCLKQVSYGCTIQNKEL